MPAKKSSTLSEGDGPAIRMDKSDHRRTASCGRSKKHKHIELSRKN